MKDFDWSEIEALGVKDKIIVIKSDSIDKSIPEDLAKAIMPKGCLGIVVLPEDAVIESLGLQELELIDQNIKARTSQKDANEING